MVGLAVSDFEQDRWASRVLDAQPPYPATLADRSWNTHLTIAGRALEGPRQPAYARRPIRMDRWNPELFKQAQCPSDTQDILKARPVPIFNSANSSFGYPCPIRHLLDSETLEKTPGSQVLAESRLRKCDRSWIRRSDSLCHSLFSGSPIGQIRPFNHRKRTYVSGYRHKRPGAQDVPRWAELPSPFVEFSDTPIEQNIPLGTATYPQTRHRLPVHKPNPAGTPRERSPHTETGIAYDSRSDPSSI